jgi:alpha-L-fucosidase
MDERYISRRHFLASSAALAASHVTGLKRAVPMDVGRDPRPRPSPVQLAWQEAELGLLFSYDLHVFDGVRYHQRENRRIRFTDAGIFQPSELDTDQWIQATAEAGARFAILTTSHENGFRLWQSDANPFCLRATGWRDGRGDVVRDFVDSCRSLGIKPGVYIGARWNGRLGVLDYKVTEGSPLTQEAYNALIEAECLELATRYGELFEVWFDGGIDTPEAGGPDVLPIWEKHQPDCLFYHSNQRRDVRWGGSETGTVPYPCWATVPDSGRATYTGHRSSLEALGRGDPEGRDWCPAMSDAPLRGFGGHEWFWEPRDEDLIYPLDELVEMYERSVGHNSTLILGVTPDDRGLLPEADVERLRGFGEAIRRRYGEAIAAAVGGGSEVTVRFPGPQQVDRVVIQEDIRRGERVREYTMAGLVGGKWVELAEGSCIGHKRIQPVAPVEVSGLRLQVTRSADTPVIRRLAAYDTSRTARGSGVRP